MSRFDVIGCTGKIFSSHETHAQAQAQFDHMTEKARLANEQRRVATYWAPGGIVEATPVPPAPESVDEVM